jgi:hypothetical protein
MSTVDHYIVATTNHYRPGTTTIAWTDPVTGNSRSTVVADNGTRIQAQWTHTWVAAGVSYTRYTTVQYATRTWWVGFHHVPASWVRSGQGQLGARGWVDLSTVTGPAQLKKALEDGQLRVARRGVVNGRSAIELQYTARFPYHAEPLFNPIYWVDAHTYHPLRMAWPHSPGTAIDILWIPKSPATVAETNKPQIPAGFKRTTIPPRAGGITPRP